MKITAVVVKIKLKLGNKFIYEKIICVRVYYFSLLYNSVAELHHVDAAPDPGKKKAPALNPFQ
jgi:hypothetical protein